MPGWVAAANVVASVTPRTRGFGVRRRAFSAAGLSIDPTARLCGGVTCAGSTIVIGPRTWIGSGTEIISTAHAPVRIGADCDVAPGVLFVVGSHELGPPGRRAGKGTAEPIDVGDGTWIGARAVLLGGTTIGRGCVVAAGAVVRGAFPENSLIGGVPARIIRSLDDSGDVDAR